MIWQDSTATMVRYHSRTLIGTQIAHFKITSKLGEGGMGEVYRATDTRLNRDVAIKVLPDTFMQDPQRLARFEREAQLLASLNHTNIGGIHGLEKQDGHQYLILELVEGQTLGERMARGPIPLDETLEIARQMAEALEAAHERGVIHRDLKPANVMLTSGGEVKVLDFGLAKALEADPSSGEDLANSPTLTMAATQAGIIIGTAAYMAPEQAAGQTADRRADVWSFGVVLAEMLTGERLFTGETTSHVLAAVLRQDVDVEEVLPDVPSPIRRLVQRCLERKPRARLQAIGEARIAIEGYLADPEASEAPAAAPEPIVVEKKAPAVTRFLPWALAGGLLVSTIGLGMLARRSAPPPEVVEFTFAPPLGRSFDLDPTRPAPVAVSPDGRMLVFGATGPEGDQLFVRALDSVEARPLNGTDGAEYPFWSPDSRSIGFFTDEKLKRMEIGGGPAVSLADAVNAKSGSWSPEGVIVFAPDAVTALSRVAAAGGEAVPVTELDKDGRDLSHRHPQFLPDGRHFLYLAKVRDPDNNNVPEIRLASLDGGEERVLLRSPSRAWYSAGQILFLRETTLMSRPFDPDSLEFTGEAVPVVDDVTLISPGAAHSVFSASSGTLALQTGSNAAGSDLVWRNRAGDRLDGLGDTVRYNELHLSPDESQLAVTIRDEDTGDPDIWIFDLARGMPTRFTFASGNDDTIVWSPDGESVYFSTTRDGSPAIYRKTVFGSDEAEPVLVEEGLTLYPGAVSPDGGTLVFSYEAPGESPNIGVMELEGGAKFKSLIATEFFEYPLDLSPDGRWLLYLSTESGEPNLYITSFPGLGRKWLVSSEGLGSFAFWRRDGREIIFEFGNSLYSVAVETREDQVILGQPEVLLQNVSAGTWAGFDSTSDGERLLLREGRENNSDRSLRVILNWIESLRRR